MFVFLFIPLSTMAAACLAMALTLVCLKRRGLQTVKEEIARMAAFAGGASSNDQRVATLLDERLDRTVEAFKAKIPLAGMFLSKDKEASLKELARNELMKVVPAIRESLFSGESTGAVGELVAPVIDKVGRRLACRLFAVCALAGLIFGLLQAAILIYV